MLNVAFVPMVAAQSYLVTGVLVVVALIALFAVILALNFGSLWLQAFSSGCRVPITSFVGMWLR